MRLPYLVRKVLQLVALLFAVVVFNFLLFRVLPGDPTRLYARSGRLTPEVVEQIRAVFGLDKPLLEQFRIYLTGLLHGDLGFSYTYRRPVSEIIGERLVNTLVLLTAATILVIVIGIVLGRVGGLAPRVQAGQHDRDLVARAVEHAHVLDGDAAPVRVRGVVPRASHDRASRRRWRRTPRRSGR